MKIVMVLTSHDQLGEHGPQDRILAGRIRRIVFRLSRRAGRVDAGVA